MATKFKDITPAPAAPALTDQLVGVGAGGTDYLYSATQLGAALSPTPPNIQTGSSYTLALTDIGGMVAMNNSGANACTVPPNSSVAFPVGTLVDVLQYGAGVTTIVAGSGVTILTAGSLAVPAQYDAVSLYQIAANTWILFA